MRRFLCLVLVACLIFSVFALPASAVAATTVTFGGLEAVAAIIAGLGVTINSLENFEVFNNLVSSVFDTLTAQNFIDAAGTISAISSGDKIYLPKSVVQSVKDWFFSSGTITTPYPYQISNTYYYPSDGTAHTASSSSPIYVYYFWGLSYNGGRWYTAIAISSTNLFVNGKDWGCNYITATYGSNNGDQADLPYTYVGQLAYGQNFISDFAASWSADSVDPSHLEGITISEVSPDSNKSLEDNYPVWLEGAITYPPITLPGGTEEDEAIPYVPVSIPSYSSSTPAIPPAQTVIWSGVQQDTDTDTEETEPSVPVVPDVGDGDITTSVSSILTVVQSILTSLVEFKDAALDWIQVAWAAFVAGLMDTLTGIKDAIIAIPGVIVGAIEALAATVTSIWEWLQEVFGLTIQQILEILTSIQAWALGLVDALILALSDLLTKIFAVDVAAVQAAVAELRAEFPFFDSIIATGEFLYNGITSGEPPVIYAYLQNAEGRYNWGTTVAVLDMSFYSRYKSTGDAIMSAALYAFFGWRTFVRLPGIISGAGSDIKEVTNHYDI